MDDEKNLEKPHFIVKDVQNEFHTNWCGKLIDAKPVFKNDKPIFVIIGSQYRLELNTMDLKYIEKVAKRMTCPKGRQAVVTDSARIYVKEETGHEKLLGVVSHTRTKTFMPFFFM
jgi:hypothetical protein